MIFYSLCNFALDLPFDKTLAESKGFKEIQKLNPGWTPDFTSTYNFPPDSQKTIIVKSVIHQGVIKSVSFLPVYISKKTSQPEIITSNDERFGQVVEYLKDVSKDQGLGTAYTVDGDEVYVS
jgi:poly-gamma-glutamate synthesis protein (capsule biosynthesis protein)